jgi:hypothetical protein
MKIRLLETVTHAGLNGYQGQVLEVSDDLAADLQRHGYAEFVGEESESQKKIEKPKHAHEEESHEKKSHAAHAAHDKKHK